jgi:hypothetical protein
MKIIGINSEKTWLVMKFPKLLDGFITNFPIEVEEVDEVDGKGEKLIKRKDDSSEKPITVSKEWFEIEY